MRVALMRVTPSLSPGFPQLFPQEFLSAAILPLGFLPSVVQASLSSSLTSLATEGTHEGSPHEGYPHEIMRVTLMSLPHEVPGISVGNPCLFCRPARRPPGSESVSPPARPRSGGRRPAGAPRQLLRVGAQP